MSGKKKSFESLEDTQEPLAIQLSPVKRQALKASFLRPYIAKRVVNKNIKYGKAIQGNVANMKKEIVTLKQSKEDVNRRLQELNLAYTQQKQQYEATSEELNRLREGLSITNKERNELEKLRKELETVTEKNAQEWTELNYELEKESDMLEKMLAFIDENEPVKVLKEAIFEMLNNVDFPEELLDKYDITQLKQIFVDLNNLRSLYDDEKITIEEFQEGLDKIFPEQK